MSNVVSVKIDLAHALLEVNAPSSELDHVFGKVLEILPLLAQQRASAEDDDEPGSIRTEGESKSPAVKKQKRRAAKRMSPVRSQGDEGDSGRKLGASFYKDFEPIELGLGDKKEIEAKEKYVEKSPVDNADKALVAIYLLSTIGDRANCTYDEIYQLLRIVGEKSPPANMSAAVGKLIEASLVAKEAEGIRIKIQGRDQVDQMSGKKLD